MGTVLHEYGVRGPLLMAVRSLYHRSRSFVHIAGSKSYPSPVRLQYVGLRQGCLLSSVLFIIFMDRISRRSQGLKGVWFILAFCRGSSLLFAEEAVPLASLNKDFQYVLGRFAAECKAVGMKISTCISNCIILPLSSCAELIL